MKTMKIKIPWENFHDVNRAIKASGVKFWPYQKIGTNYIIEFAPKDHPLTTFLLLKYGEINITH